MLTAIFAFVKTPLGKKIVGYGLIGIGLLVWFRWQTNKAWEQGFDKGKVKGIEELTKAKEAEWEERQKGLDEQNKALDEALTAAASERQRLASSRAVLKSDLDRGITALREELNRSAGEVAQIPASELDAAIKQNLAVLR